MNSIPIYRLDSVLTFDLTMEIAGYLTVPEGAVVVKNQLILPGGRRLSADGCTYSAGRGWDGLSWVGTPTEAGR